jgi:hypothetical protein
LNKYVENFSTLTLQEKSIQEEIGNAHTVPAEKAVGIM